MAANGRGGMRPSGRSPPFLLIGLTVVLCIVGFNYWNVSSRNSHLSTDLTALKDQMRSQTAMRINAEKRSENAASRIRDCEENQSRLKQMFDENKMSIKKSKDRLNTKESELQSTATDLKRCQDDKVACEEDKIGINEQLHEVQERLTEKEKEVATQPKCGFEECKAEIGNIVNILTNTIGKEPIKNSLLQNNIDVASLMSQAGGSDAIKQGSNSENLQGNQNYQVQQPGQIDSRQPVDPSQHFFEGQNAVNNNNNRLQAGGFNPQIDSRQPVDPNQQFIKGQNAVDNNNNNNQLQAGGFNRPIDSRQPVDPNQQFNKGQNTVDNNQPQAVQDNLQYPGGQGHSNNVGQSHQDPGNQNQLPPVKSGQPDTDQHIPANADGNQPEPNHANLEQPGNIDQHDQGAKGQFQPNPDQKGQFPVNKGQSASDPKDKSNPSQIAQNTVQEALKGNTGTEQQILGQGPVKVGQEQLKVGQEQLRSSQELKPGQEEIKNSQEQVKSDRESIDTPKNPISNAESTIHQQQNMLHVSQENKVPGSNQLENNKTLESQEQPKSPTQLPIPNQIDKGGPEEDESKKNDAIVDKKVTEKSPGKDKGQGDNGSRMNRARDEPREDSIDQQSIDDEDIPQQ
ncbi:homeobox protein 2 isoform X2 [Patella vulgata]|uniref:homeobox protein 2 isoform X2 n=1 Tax=Patella vulgata TaxID=6465 RepID=UPI00217F8FD3|nr:homeobox protein 2 isoform X2 [Patella vulgata]